MCHYCGCRHVSLIRDYIAEHERVTDLGGDAVRALDVGDLEKTQRCIQEMAVLLAAHWQGEENGIFRVMQREEEFADYIAPLIEEHRELAEFLDTVDVNDATTSSRSVSPSPNCMSTSAKRRTGSFQPR